jgi:malate synthase
VVAATAKRATSTANVDSEIRLDGSAAEIVPVMNARYALNAANAAGVRLYDALYGTDAIAEDGGAQRVQATTSYVYKVGYSALPRLPSTALLATGSTSVDQRVVDGVRVTSPTVAEPVLQADKFIGFFFQRRPARRPRCC